MSRSRRSFLALAGFAVPAAAQMRTPGPPTCAAFATTELPLREMWGFRVETAPFDAANPVEAFRKQDHSRAGATTVPHTWQVSPETAGYMGAAWYYTAFDAPADIGSGVFRLEFEAVYHSAWVFVNGEYAGSHLRKGYTAFELDITRLVRLGKDNVIAVRVDNSFNPNMLPRADSFDWTPDGGIYRPVHLWLSPKSWISRVQVEAQPEGDNAVCTVRIDVPANAPSGAAVRIIEEGTDRNIFVGDAVVNRPTQIRLNAAKRWHFDSPQLYRLEVMLPSGDEYTTTFGVRRFEVRDGGFFLNGERVKLGGVERMAGSHPLYGMAEPTSWIDHDHADMKELNCVFTRVHWAQDRRVLDYCDRHGIMMQLEVPTWGPDTFKGMDAEVAPDIMQNGLEQLREMIARDYNHPSVVAWGLCNEVDGRRPAAKQFIRNMAAEARRLDRTRLLTYASNTLQGGDVATDAAGELDFISWNEYYGSWYAGSPRELRSNLQRIVKAFPGKPIVVSEYGYCACTPDRPEGDPKRVQVLREHDAVFREFPEVAGLIFFDYNDYRTHIGDKGLGVLKQRVHGVVDVYGNRKPSFEELRREHSPVAGIGLTSTGSGLRAVVRSTSGVPAYTLRGYRLRWVVYGGGDIPLETGEALLPEMAPGSEAAVTFAWKEKTPSRVTLDVVRPTGFSAWTEVWKPTLS